MSGKVIFQIKQILKMTMQHIVLPSVYGFWRMIYSRKKKDKIVFADAHHDEIPFSMIRLHEMLEQRGYSIHDRICDFDKMSFASSFFQSLRFMRLYAQAEFVFICDNFLPVSSCCKAKDTIVVQLLHSCGLLKKMGYDTKEDIPKGYIGNVYKNYDLVTVSASCCVEPLTKAMRQKEGILQPLGISRTDCYFDDIWVADCIENFQKRYPEAVGKKVILWAPTFRGNAGNPKQEGMEAIIELKEKLGDDYFVIYKVHPHVDRKYHLSNCEIPTEELLPVVDLMITDYSSVVMDYMVFERPYVLFAPDLKTYEEDRGLYIEYKSLCPYVVTKDEMLQETVLKAIQDDNVAWIQKQRQFHLENCDGKVSERILDYLGLGKAKEND